MALLLRLTTVLVLMLQALNGEQPPDTGDFVFQPFFTDGGVPDGILDSSTGIPEQRNMTEMNRDSNVVPTLNSTIPGAAENVSNNPAWEFTNSTTNGTAGNPSTPSPDNILPTTNVTWKNVTLGANSTGPKGTDLPEVSNATISSPVDTNNESWASNHTASEPNVTVTVAPESKNYTSSTPGHISGPPQANSTTTTSNSTNTTTINRFTNMPTSNTTRLTTKDMAGGSGNDTDRGLLVIEGKEKKNTIAWGAIIVTALIVALLGCIIYVILKKNNGRQFMHRKLVEDMPSEPVLRLDNSEPLDFKYGGSAYYNPGLQGDHIQMTNFPQGHMH